MQGNFYIFIFYNDMPSFFYIHFPSYSDELSFFYTSVPVTQFGKIRSSWFWQPAFTFFSVAWSDGYCRFWINLETVCRLGFFDSLGVWTSSSLTSLFVGCNIYKWCIMSNRNTGLNTLYVELVNALSIHFIELI